MQRVSLFSEREDPAPYDSVTKNIRRGLGRALRDEKFRRNAHRSQNIGLVADGACVTKKDPATNCNSITHQELHCDAPGVDQEAISRRMAVLWDTSDKRIASKVER